MSKKKGGSGEIPPVWVRVPPAVHKKVKAVAATRGEDIGESYTEALRRWLEWLDAGAKTKTPLGDLAPEEMRLLTLILEIWRRPGEPSHDSLQWILQQLVAQRR